MFRLGSELELELALELGSGLGLPVRIFRRWALWSFPCPVEGQRGVTGMDPTRYLALEHLRRTGHGLSPYG